MPTQCNQESFAFATMEGRRVEAAFDGGAVTSEAGALLLGAADRAVRLMDRFAACFHDTRRPELIEHQVRTLVGQRVMGIALGYEDLIDHDELRHDPVLACWPADSPPPTSRATSQPATICLLTTLTGTDLSLSSDLSIAGAQTFSTKPAAQPRDVW
jgi:hypothetical protein